MDMSALTPSTKCSVPNNLLKMSSNISSAVFRLVSVSTGWVSILCSHASSPQVEKKVDTGWLLQASCLALLVGVTAISATLPFFDLLLVGMVEVDKMIRKKHELKVT